MDEKEAKVAEATKLLATNGWGEDAIEAALHPTPEQARDNLAMLPIANVNPEQHAAIQNLHRAGWGAHDIGQVIPVTEADIAKVIRIFYKEFR